MESQRPYDALIIGAGIGGLSAGIILSLLRFRVAVIEKNPLPGGLMRGYRREGMDCPVGVHYFGSFGEGEPLRRICDYLGVSERMAVERMGRGGPIDRYLFDDFTFDLPEGLDAFAASLTQAFPDDRQPIAQIVDNLRAISDAQNSFAFSFPGASPSRHETLRAAERLPRRDELLSGTAERSGRSGAMDGDVGGRMPRHSTTISPSLPISSPPGGSGEPDRIWRRRSSRGSKSWGAPSSAAIR